MGRARSRPVAGPGAWLTVFVLLPLAACSLAQPSISDLLLSPGDFPEIVVTRTDLQVGETVDGEPTGQVVLSGPDFTLRQSVVLFETREKARSVLAGIKADQTARGITLPGERGAFDDVSGVLHEVRGVTTASNLFFVQRRVFARVTVSGPQRLTLLPLYAEKARVKVGGR